MKKKDLEKRISELEFQVKNIEDYLDRLTSMDAHLAVEIGMLKHNNRAELCELKKAEDSKEVQIPAKF